MPRFAKRSLVLPLCGLLLLAASPAWSAEKRRGVQRDYAAAGVLAAPAPAQQTAAEAEAKSVGCVSCHTDTDAKTMHASPAVVLGCTDCHGGNPTVRWMEPPVGAPGQRATRADYVSVRDRAHVLPRYPDAWGGGSSRIPERTYTLLNREAPEFVRFVNPGDLRVARESCGACHLPIVEAAERSLMATTAMLWGGAAYNNGLLPYKRYILGEFYLRDGRTAIVNGPPVDEAEAQRHGVLPFLVPLPRWENLAPADIFRVFERGGRNILNTFPEIGLPNVVGQIQRLEEPGRPDIRQSARGPGTGARIAVPVLNIHKTRLNDPTTWFLGTNDQPGDYRSSGCSACHVVYANDRDPRHAGPYAVFGHDGDTQTADPTIPRTEPGHPLAHRFTRSIPTSQCMTCHMHQPNMFLNSMLGYTMWDYESDAPLMWPKEQRFPSAAEMRRVLDRNPEGAAPRGNWADLQFLKRVWTDVNPRARDTQFADYHGHGWNFRAIYKRDRKGNLLDAQGRIIANDDPDKFRKAVHLNSIHVQKGMHCVDCHFAQDSHGNGHIYGEVGQAVEIECKDCHGTATALPTLRTSGPAAGPAGLNLAMLRNPDGRKRFEWIGDRLIQRSVVDPRLEWEVSLVKRTVTPGDPSYNPKAARAKLMSRDTHTQKWGPDIPVQMLVHKDDDMECYACHTSWTPSCGGCHLPIEANWKTARHHYEGDFTRNYATYNPQVAREEIFILGRRGPAEGSKIAPVRSSSALVLSSVNANRERIYVQQPPISASGYSSQAMNAHYPHTERTTETRVCSDCHLSKKDDNNAVMAQTLGQGTQFINLVGFHAYVGTDRAVVAVKVTEWDEPQAVVGSHLHRYAYPKWWREHLARGRRLNEGAQNSSGSAHCVQLRGEYLFAAEGPRGMRVYDVASIGNKGVSQRLIEAPFSRLGHDTRIESRNATCVVLPTTQPVHPERMNTCVSPPLLAGRTAPPDCRYMQTQNLEQPFRPIYSYAIVTDAEEGLILVDVNTLADGEFRNNFLKRALTWNPDGILNGARHATVAGDDVYVSTPKGIVVLSLADPLRPRLLGVVDVPGAIASMVQFRYLFVTSGAGLDVVDVTRPASPRLLREARVPLQHAGKLFVSRTWAFVANGREGLAIIDVERPTRPRLYRLWNADGGLRDARDVIVASTNASLFAYVADGVGGLKVVQLTSPESQPNFYGFAPEPRPELIAYYPTAAPALSLSRPLERDRAVDETGGQVAVFGRRGARPLNLAEMQRLYLDRDGKPWFVEDDIAEMSK
jgi:hypothetical protein